MDDSTLTTFAQGFYIAFPIGLLVVAKARRGLRPKVASILCATTPLSLLFICVTVDYVLDPGLEPTESWAIFAVWIMSFVPYVLMIFIGGILAAIRRPKSLGSRFFMAFTLSVLVILGQQYLHI